MSSPAPNYSGEARIGSNLPNQYLESNVASGSIDNNDNHPEGLTNLKVSSIVDNNDNEGMYDRIFIALDLGFNEESEIQLEPTRIPNNSNDPQDLTSRREVEILDEVPEIMEEVPVIASEESML
ncbi:hypothetical protein B9Z55_002981 [Caenorhabditis nigoni]|uniref:Uncharacterized protein n=1 Tax=Caenorhabditis nigoni TaxID=1611254 RepID=A0A2G5VNK1_9PELO|nr:hypothetical protein B9Z55_002981 [Caenorhabditis nigoni]